MQPRAFVDANRIPLSHISIPCGFTYNKKKKKIFLRYVVRSSHARRNAWAINTRLVTAGKSGERGLHLGEYDDEVRLQAFVPASPQKLT